MTNKELLYVEDAINHEQNIISYLEFEKNNLSNKILVKYFEEEINHHQEYLNELLNEMEVCSNE